MSVQIVGVLALVGLMQADAATTTERCEAWAQATAGVIADTTARHVAVAPFLGDRAEAAGRLLAGLVSVTLAADGRWEVAELPVGMAPDAVELARLSAAAGPETDRVVLGSHALGEDGLTLRAVLVGLPDGSATELPSLELPWDADLLALCGHSYSADEQRGLRPALRDVVSAARAADRRQPAVMEPAGAFGLRLVVDGRQREPALRGHEAVSRVSEGETYTIRLTNNSAERVGVALFIDGLNSIGQRRELPSAGLKWILEPGETLDVGGWQLGEQRREFRVVGAPHSVAGGLGLTDELGLVTASFYAADDASLPAEERRGLQLGTGEGDAAPSPVTLVDFRAAAVPAAMLALRYETSRTVIGGRNGSGRAGVAVVGSAGACPHLVARSITGHPRIRGKLYGKPIGSAVQPPPILTAEQNVVPQQRREVWQAVVRDGRLLIGQTLDRLGQVDRVPQRDGGHDQVQAAGPILHVLELRLLNHAPAEEEHRSGQGVPFLALVGPDLVPCFAQTGIRLEGPAEGLGACIPALKPAA